LYPEAKKAVLFNLEIDPNEMEDLSNDTNYKELKKELFKDLIEMQKKMNDTLDLMISFPELSE
jgi:hypothetical protein